MKILFVLENYIPHIGGVEVVFRNLAEGLAREGNDVTVLTHRMAGTAEYEVINNVKVHRVPVPGFAARYFFSVLAIPMAITLARDADVIHTTTFTGAPPAWVASRIYAKPCVITVHEVWLGHWKEYTEMPLPSTIMHEFLERLIYTLPYDHYACVSNATKRSLLASVHRIDRASTVYNGLDYKIFNPEKATGNFRKELGLSGKFVFLAYGRPGASKGFSYLVRAVPLIAQAIPHAKLLLILSRDKAYAQRYRELVCLIRELGIEDKVLIHDPVPYKELPLYLNTADCVVVPSITEGFGYTAAEACAMERPVVASNSTSLPEVVHHKFVLVRPKDPEAIAQGVIMVSRKQCHTSPKKRFTIEDNIKGYLSIYHKLLKK